MEIDVHNYDLQLKVQENLLETAMINPENKKLILQFANFCKTTDGVGKARITKYIFNLRRICQITDKHFRDIQEEDIIDILANLQDYRTAKGNHYSEHTIYDYKKTMSKFWRWLYYNKYQGAAPPPIKRLRLKMSRNGKEPEIFTKEEIAKIIQGATNARDKAFFSCLYDLQARVSELLSRKIQHIRHTDEGDVQILIEADKTGNSHWETLFESVSNFTTWLKMHPDKNNAESPLWVTMNKSRIQPLRYATIRKSFGTIIAKQKIRKGKHSTIHMLRKSKATHDLADGVPITYIESRGSWSKGSSALRDCYLAVQQKDKDNAYRKKYSLQSNGKSRDMTVLSRCKRCESIIEADTKFCSRCGLPTDSKIATQKQHVDVASLIDKDMLSEMVKRYVLQEMKKKVAP